MESCAGERKRKGQASRLCCVCRVKKNVKDLIRVGKYDGKFFVDERDGAHEKGRGCHVCPECVEKCVKTRALNRSYKTNVPNEIYDDLKNQHTKYDELKKEVDRIG